MNAIPTAKEFYAQKLASYIEPKTEPQSAIRQEGYAPLLDMPTLGCDIPKKGKDYDHVPMREELYQLAIEFLLDVISPEGYGHAMPVEVRQRASRILKLSEATRKVPAHGFDGPPPVRCEACDSQ